MSGPIPQGNYVPARRHGGRSFTAGMTPRRDGVLVFHDPVRGDEPETRCEAVTLACRNAPSAARDSGEGESIAAIFTLTVHFAAKERLTAHSRPANFASKSLISELGAVGSSSRCALGVTTLPGGAPIVTARPDRYLLHRQGDQVFDIGNLVVLDSGEGVGEPSLRIGAV